MAGHNIARLNQAIAGMKPDAVEHAQRGWTKGGRILAAVVSDLQTTQDNIDAAFAPSSSIRKAASEVLATVRQGVERDQTRMDTASNTLLDVATVMRQTQSKADAMPAEAPGNPPKVEGGPFEDDADEVHALKVYAAKSRMYTQQVNAYNQSDADAAAQVEHLNRTYDHAADVFSGMHDDTSDGSGSTGTGTTSTGGSGGPGVTTTRPRSYTTHHATTTFAGPTETAHPGTGAHHTGSTSTGTAGTDTGGPGTGTGGTGTGGPGTGGPGTGGPQFQIDPSGDPPPFDSGTFEHGDDPSSAGPFGSGFTPGAVGVGGVLGGLGLRGLLSGAPSTTSSVSVPGQAVTRSIGTSARSGAGSVLGRSGTAAGRGGSVVPGQQTSRGAAGRGVGSAGGRGRGKKDDEDGDEKEIYDVERDWTDDEGQYPGVIS